MTNTLLRIDTSARRTGSISRDLTDAIAQRLSPKTTITRDLADALPQIDEEWVGANFTPADHRSDEQRKKLTLSNALIDELRAADTIIIGVPVYNFGVPTALKAWIDLIARAGETFKYTETGPVGLLDSKKVYIAMAAGGVPVGSPMDYATTYLTQVLNFVGLTDIEIIAADGMATDAANKLKAANDAVANIAA